MMKKENTKLRQSSGKFNEDVRKVLKVRDHCTYIEKYRKLSIQNVICITEKKLY